MDAEDWNEQVNQLVVTLEGLTEAAKSARVTAQDSIQFVKATKWPAFVDRVHAMNTMVEFLEEASLVTPTVHTPPSKRQRVDDADDDVNDPLRARLSPVARVDRDGVVDRAYDVIDVEGDGNCLFRATARALREWLGATQSMPHKTLRKLAADWIDDHVEWTENRKIQTTTDRGRVFNTKKQYTTYMRKDGRWGGALEIEALSAHFGVCICVIYDHDETEEVKRQTCIGHEYDDTITLVYKDKVHYQVAVFE